MHPHAYGRRRLPVEQESRRSRLKRNPNPQIQPSTVVNENSFVLTRPITFTITQPAQPTETDDADDAITTTGIDPDLTPTPRPLPSSTTSRAVPTPSITVNNTGSGGSPDPVQGSSQNGRLSGGAIAGIVIGVLLVLAAIVGFLLRKRLMSNRRKKRDTWVGPKPSSSDVMVSRERAVTGAGPSTAGPSAMMTPSVIVPARSPYNNSHPSHASSVTSSPGFVPYSSMGTPTTAGSLMANAAIVKSTFIPTLPDELSINIGEVVRVLAEYDDGWVLCSNALGEKGMVPSECLERGVGLALRGPGTSIGGPSRRASSLAPR